MSRWKSAARPTPALVIAVLALVAALAGSAIAADPVANTAVSKKKTKKIAKKEAKKFFNANIGDATVASAGNAEELGGQPPSAYEEPVAYAHIRADGTVITSESKSFATSNVTTRPAASFCLHGLPTFKSVSATPDYAGTGGDEQTDKSVQIGKPGTGTVGGCGGISGLQAEVATVVDSNYLFHGIFIQLYN